jgi:hypothetical protein
MNENVEREFGVLNSVAEAGNAELQLDRLVEIDGA